MIIDNGQKNAIYVWSHFWHHHVQFRPRRPLVASTLDSPPEQVPLKEKQMEHTSSLVKAIDKVKRRLYSYGHLANTPPCYYVRFYFVPLKCPYIFLLENPGYPVTPLIGSPG